MRRIIGFGIIIALVLLLSGAAQGASISWAENYRTAPDLWLCRGPSGGATGVSCCLNYNVQGTVSTDVVVTVTPEPNNRAHSSSFTAMPGRTTQVCVGDSADVMDSEWGAWTISGGWGDTPLVEFDDPPLGTYCSGKDRTWHWFTLRDNPNTKTGFSVQCIDAEPDLLYGGSPVSTSFVFEDEGDFELEYSRLMECNLDIAVVEYYNCEYHRPVWTCEEKYLTIADGLRRPMDPRNPKIYRSFTNSVDYWFEVLSPLSMILTTSAAVNKDTVYPGETFIGTVTISNVAGRTVNLDSYSISGDHVGGRSICRFTLTPGSVRAGRSAQAIISCTVPAGTSPRTISGIEVSFDADANHPCTGDKSYTVLIPPVDVIEEPPLGPCEDGIDNDGDGKIDCFDNDGAENCCMSSACPIFRSNEGANNFICCNNGLDEDGDLGRDCFDTDCCLAPICPYDDNANSEGLNNKLCCSNRLDDDRDRKIDASDPDCLDLGPCEDGIDNDGDGKIDCFDNDGAENCCTDPACPFKSNEGANNFICCTNNINEDGDSGQDCFDTDCCMAPLCPYDNNPNSEGLNGMRCCYNRLDEDRDGLIDAADPNCIILGPCEDGIDNDHDGLIDCNDAQEGGISCCIDPACPVFRANEGANNYVCCNNGLNEDGGGMDCLDVDCCSATQCPYDDNANSEGLNDKLCCANGLDEDNDGLADAADPDCIALGPCEDGIDNDGDGKIDCFDNDGAEACCASPACPVYAVNEGANAGICCNNTLDDDMDTLIDVADPDCQAGILCSVYSDWYNAVGAPDNPCITEPYDFLDNGFIDPRTVCVRDDDGDGLFDQQCDKNQAPPIVVPIG